MATFFPLYLARIFHVPICVCGPFSCSTSAPLSRAQSVLQTWPPKRPYWNCPCMPSALSRGVQTRHQALNLTSAGQRDRIRPFALPAVFLLTQPEVHSAFATWACCGSWETGHPGIGFGFGVSLQSCSLSSRLPGCSSARDDPKCRPWH